MLSTELGAERSAVVEVNVVLNHHARPRSSNVPFAGLAVDDRNRPPRGVCGADIFYVGREVAHLVERVPHRQIERNATGGVGKSNADMREVVSVFGQRNKILGGLRLRVDGRRTRDRRGSPQLPGACNRKQEAEKQFGECGSGRVHHAGVDTSWSEFSFAGSFS